MCMRTTVCVRIPILQPKPHLNALPPRVGVEPEVHVVLQGRGQTVHERRSRCDGVAVCQLALLCLGQLHESGKTHMNVRGSRREQC